MSDGRFHKSAIRYAETWLAAPPNVRVSLAVMVEDAMDSAAKSPLAPFVSEDALKEALWEIEDKRILAHREPAQTFRDFLRAYIRAFEAQIRRAEGR